MKDVTTARRGFLGRVIAALLGVAAVPSLGRTLPTKEQSLHSEEPWLRGLNGKHRQFFDAPSLRDGRSLQRVMNFLDAYGEAYDLKDSDLNAVYGAHGSGLAVVFSDVLWAKYELGTRLGEMDARTKAAASRNPYAEGGDYSVARLQQRGVRFLACLRSIRRLSGELATQYGPAEQIRSDLTANLLPGVTPVPAMIVAANRAQESGLTYVFMG